MTQNEWRIERALESFPESSIMIISNKLESSKEYKRRISPYASKRNIHEISNCEFALDGLNFANYVVFLCGNWWENKNSVKFIRDFSVFAKKVIPVSELPFKGGGNE